MNKRNLNSFKQVLKCPMTVVMAKAWILSTRIYRHAVPVSGLLRSAREVQE